MKSRFREPISGLIHLFSAILSFAGLIFLLGIPEGDRLVKISVGVYGVSLVLLFSASAAYHLIRTGEPGLGRLRKLDHAAIYILIAGTYTPICIHFLSGSLRIGFLVLIWVFATMGVAIKIFMINAPRWITAGVYLFMGWMVVFVIKPLLGTIPAAGWLWLTAGGVLFTIGAVVYITKKLDFFPGVFGFHEVWHVFVTMACFCHFVLIYQYVAGA